MTQEVDRDKQIKDLTDKMVELDKLEDVKETLKNNVREFKIGEILYRIRRPNLELAQELNIQKQKKYMELLNAKNDKGEPLYEFEDSLIARYEKLGKSVPKMIEEMAKLQIEIENLQVKLAQFGKEKEEDNKNILVLKIAIYELIQKQVVISLEKQTLLSYSIESQLGTYVNFYQAYLLLEKKVDEKWERVFKTYVEFKASDDEELLSKTAHYYGILLSERIF